MRSVGRSCFGACVLIGSDEVGASRLNANGLPSVSSSVKMIGNFQRLLSLNHENLCLYLDLHRCISVANSIVLISEHYDESLADFLDDRTSLPSLSIAQDISSALSYLHSEGVCIGFFRSSTVRLYQEGGRWKTRLSQYGLRHVTSDSKLLLEPLIHDYYAAPEVLLRETWKTSMASDIWALGIILLELFMGKTLSKIWSFAQYAAILQRLFQGSQGKSIYSSLLAAVKTASTEEQHIPEKVEQLIERCLAVIPSQRPSAADIMEILDCPPREDPSRLKAIEEIQDEVASLELDWKLSSTDMDVAFNLWKLCGATPEGILVKRGHIKVQFPVQTVPILVVEDLRLFGNDESRRCCSPRDIYSLSSKNLLEKLDSIDISCFAHSVEMQGVPNGEEGLSLMVKEKDVAYQLSRSLLIRHLLNCSDRSLLRQAVRFDIPPVVRGEVWARLLGVRAGNCLDFYELDTLAAHSSDRQLDVDIPRCHQYDELMTSPSAHWKLRRLLKAWLLSHPEYVYWQGCDSLSTPFLLLHFNELPKALICLSEFVNKYLFNFFLKDNSAVIQEHLAVFFQLLAYTDAKYYATLVGMDFYPELFAIPWFLTCFAHVLPIHKLLYVWDVLLLHDSSFPLFVGLALLRQLRPRIMESNFNDVILFFSDLPDMSMDRVVSDSAALYKKVPPSCAKRCHSYDFAAKIQDEGELRSLNCSLMVLSHVELKQWHCPRLSPEEFGWRVLRQQIAVLDIRNPLEFARGHVMHSMNCPANSTALLSIAVVLKAAQTNGHPICVVGGKDMDTTKQFVSMLVLENHVDGICVIDGGFESVRDHTEIIGIPE